MKALKYTLLLLVALVVALAAMRNSLIKREAKRMLNRETGFGLELGKVDVGLFSTSVDLHDVKLLNPPDFPEPLAFDVRQVKADYDLRSLFADEVRLSEVILDVPMAVIVKNEKGETNLQRLSAAGKKGGAAKPAPEPGEQQPESAKKAPKPFRIDTLVVRLGTVEVHDYTVKGDKPGVTKLTLDIDQVHTNVTSVSQIGTLMVGGVLQQVTASYMNELARGLEKAAQDPQLKDDIQKAGKKIGKAFDSLFRSGEQNP